MIPPCLNYVATLPCDVSLITVHVPAVAVFLTLIFHKVV